MAHVYTVTQINSYIKNMFRQDFVLNHISVKGEISNCKYHSSGHIYFTLKDGDSTLSIIMFASMAANLKFRLENGMKVVIDGRIDVYERDGKYQLYASKVEQDGLGELFIRYERLKQQYEEMGYFSNQYKRRIPKYSKRIGIVTAVTGAAIQDILNISHRRNPYVSLILYPALVQGEMAKYSIVKGIQILDKLGLDVIIVGRGGGSIEDLWAFNEEMVVEAVFSCNTPVISAIGHETDYTITDFVSDLRAPTPSAAAELAVADYKQLENTISSYNESLNIYFEKRINACRNKLDSYDLKLKYLSPISQINEKRQRLVNISEKLDAGMNNIFISKKHQLEMYSSVLNGLSPLNKLSQGYSFAEHLDGRVINSVNDVNNNDIINVYVKDGKMKAEVKEVKNGKIIDY